MGRSAVALGVVAMLVLAGCTAGYQPAASVPDRSDPPANDHLGYYDGYWHNDTFDIDASDGLTDSELEAVVSRAMARVQLLRGLRFERDVGVEVVSRATFRREFGDVWREPSGDRRALDNVQYEALFLVGSDEDVVEVRRNNRGGTVLGFYQPSAERIVVVGGERPSLNGELTLAHELLHALQDQHFGLASLGASTLDGRNARSALIEGDAVVVERAYERNCRTGEWQCVGAGSEGGAAPPSGFHWGVYFLGFFPYAEGPTFIEHHRRAGGWERIDALYADHPTASAEIIRPETYDTGVYGAAVVRDRTTGGWERIRIEDGPDAATVGRAGIASMFAYTAYAGDSPGVIDRTEFRNRDPDTGSIRPYTYDVPHTEGWYGDRIHAYERGGETAYVWNVTFTDAENATAFREGYERVVAHWGGRRIDTADESVWTLEAADRFDGAVRIDRDGNAVTVVKAPSRAALDSVRAPSHRVANTPRAIAD
jgi:hypothetical protein